MFSLFMVDYSVINNAAIMQPSLPLTFPPVNTSSVLIKPSREDWSSLLVLTLG